MVPMERPSSTLTGPPWPGKELKLYGSAVILSLWLGQEQDDKWWTWRLVLVQGHATVGSDVLRRDPGPMHPIWRDIVSTRSGESDNQRDGKQ